MTTLTNYSASLPQTVYTLLQRSRQAAPALHWVGWALLALSVLTLVLTAIDSRQFQGVSTWLKPWKFQVSIGVYFLTLALFMAWLPSTALHSKSARYVVWAAVITGLFEVIYIGWRGALGEASHFNLKTPFDSIMYTFMGVGAVVLTSTSAVLAILIARSADYGLSPALKLAVVLGLGLTFLLGTGFGAYLSGQSSGHWVGGVQTDAGGLPIVKWSRSGGDLRVAHFFGIHAMHFIPVFGVVLIALRVRPSLARIAVWAFAVGFTALCVWTFVQAVNGRPFYS
jgi:hypothetical protein